VSSSFNKDDIQSNHNKLEIINCTYTHRAERLIHIELNDRFKADTEECKKCGKIHQEWFKVTNLDSNKVINGMHGWDEIHKVIIHWIPISKKFTVNHYKISQNSYYIFRQFIYR